MALGILYAPDGTVDDPDRIYRDIIDRADWIESILRSVREDAYRRNSAWLRIHRAEFIQEARLLSGLIRDVAALGGAR